jgi:hypothetical protein
VRHHLKVKIATNKMQFDKAVRNPLFQSVRPVNKSCCVITLRNGNVMLNKPIIVGSAILELSKLHMYNFFYNVMKVVFPRDHLRLLMTDTDSLVMEVMLRSKQRDMLDVIARHDEKNGTHFLDEFDLRRACSTCTARALPGTSRASS